MEGLVESWVLLYRQHESEYRLAQLYFLSSRFSRLLDIRRTSNGLNYFSLHITRVIREAAESRRHNLLTTITPSPLIDVYLATLRDVQDDILLVHMFILFAGLCKIFQNGDTNLLEEYGKLGGMHTEANQARMTIKQVLGEAEPVSRCPFAKMATSVIECPFLADRSPFDKWQQRFMTVSILACIGGNIHPVSVR
jgi:hypothetical protein